MRSLGWNCEDPGRLRCVSHRGPRVGRLRNPRDVVRALERLEPRLRDLLTWLDEHRVTRPSPHVAALLSPHERDGPGSQVYVV